MVAAPPLSNASEKQKVQQDLQNQPSTFTAKDVVELYLIQHIEDRKVNGKIISGVRKPKGQSETRRTLYGDAVRVLGDMPAVAVTRKDITSMVMAIIERGAKVQAGNVLRELSAAYGYVIGLEKLPDTFANPALLAKAGLRQVKVKLTCERGKHALSEVELKKLLQWLPGSAYSTTQKMFSDLLYGLAVVQGRSAQQNGKISTLIKRHGTSVIPKLV